MRWFVFSLIVSAGLVAGCAGKKVTASSSPTSDQAAAIRESILKNNPGAQVGIITYILSDRSLAMVGDIDISNLQVGNVVSILDSSETVVCHGHIMQIYDNKIAISYDMGARLPSEGDVVVKF